MWAFPWNKVKSMEVERLGKEYIRVENESESIADREFWLIQIHSGFILKNVYIFKV